MGWRGGGGSVRLLEGYEAGRGGVALGGMRDRRVVRRGIEDEGKQRKERGGLPLLAAGAELRLGHAEQLELGVEPLLGSQLQRLRDQADEHVGQRVGGGHVEKAADEHAPRRVGEVAEVWCQLLGRVEAAVERHEVGGVEP